MRVEPITFPLKSGKVCTLRPTTPGDAIAMLRFLKDTSDETPFLLRYADEWTYTLEEEQAVLKTVLESDKRLMLCAEVEGQIVGNCALNGSNVPRRARHRASFAIVIAQSHWGEGIGGHMLDAVTAIAPQMGYTQIELGVVADNVRALDLYKKHGFVEIGRTPNAFVYDEGAVRDEISMVKKLDL